MKEYHNIELLTIHNECDVVIEEIITKHIETFNIEACTSEKIYKKVIMINEILQVEVASGIAFSCIMNYSLKNAVDHTKNSIKRKYKQLLLHPYFII